MLDWTEAGTLRGVSVIRLIKDEVQLLNYSSSLREAAGYVTADVSTAEQEV